MIPRASLLVILLVSALSVAAISCQPSAGDRHSSLASSPTPEVAQTPMVIEVERVEIVDTEEGAEIRETVREYYVVTPVPPLEEAVKVQEVETDDQIEIVGIDITPGTAACSGIREPGWTPGPPNMCFGVWVTSRNNGPARTLRTQITIEDPLTGEKHTTGVDEFVDSGGTTSPGLGFFAEPKSWVVYVEVRVVP